MRQRATLVYTPRLLQGAQILQTLRIAISLGFFEVRDLIFPDARDTRHSSCDALNGAVDLEIVGASNWDKIYEPDRTTPRCGKEISTMLVLTLIHFWVKFMCTYSRLTTGQVHSAPSPVAFYS
jgi:hypothetical protein